MVMVMWLGENRLYQEVTVALFHSWFKRKMLTQSCCFLLYICQPR